MGRFEADAKLAPDAGAPVGRLALLGLDVAGLERLLTMASGTAVAWLGATGDVSVDLVRPDDTTWRVGLAFPEAEGVVLLKPDEDVLYVQSDELTARLSPDVLGALVVASDEESAFELVAPLPVAARIDGVALPWSMLSGEAFDPSLLAGSIELTGGPLALVTLDGLPVAFDEMTVALDANDIAAGMPIRLSATMPDDGSGETGSAALNGRLVHLFDDEGRFAPALGRYSGDVTFARIPTDLIDGLMKLQGKLVAAIGEAVDGSATASEFSQRTGWVDVDLTSPNGFVRGRIRGMEQGLRTAILEERQLHGALVLTPEFSHQVLGAMAPVFSDVHSTERPITFRFTSNARLPHDGNAKLIHGDIDLDVGPVAFEPSGDLLGLLSLFGEETGAVSGRIDPTQFTIRKGVVSFDKIMVHLDKFSIPFSGTVDLATDEVSMRWKVPIEQLAKTFHELEGLEGVTVPLVTKGKQGAIKTELAPEFSESLLEIGVRKGLEELLRGIGGGG